MISSKKSALLALMAGVLVLSQTLAANAAELRFQRPGEANAQSERVSKNFRRPSLANKSEAESAVEVAEQPAPKKRIAEPRRQVRQEGTQATRSKPKRVAAKRVRKSTPVIIEEEPAVVKSDRRVAQAAGETSDYDLGYEFDLDRAFVPASHGGGICTGDCTCEVSCGIGEPGCGICEPSCGCGEASCGICEPGCGIVEPSCGCGEPNCGSCVARPGPDYWCFPVCLPRFKDLSAWVGVQSYGGPATFGENGFGFNEGINLSGRAPLLGFLFPQLSYQLGYQAIQSRLEGSLGTAPAGSGEVGDRSQQFVTVGLFRRVETGLQFGFVWDMMDVDTLGAGIIGAPGADLRLQQFRGEISLKSPQGREFGFLTAFAERSENGTGPFGTRLFEPVDQYALFYRWNFRNGYESRLWGGATSDGDGLFGGDFVAPFNDRWALQTGFNYLLPDDLPSNNGVGIDAEETWNVGINLVWHLGGTAKRGCKSPYRPLFRVADNGSFLVDVE